MRRLLILFLALFLTAAMAEGATLSIETPAEAIRPGKAFLLVFSVPEDGECSLALRDTRGQHVLDVVTDLPVSAGVNQMWWNGTSDGASAPEGVYQLVLSMDGAEAACTVVIGSHAPYMTGIAPVKDAEKQTMTVDFYASVDGLLTIGLWRGNVWSLLENRQVDAGMNRIVWDASAMTEDTSALTLTLTDTTGFSSNEEHIGVNAADFGITFATETPEPTATPAPVTSVLTPVTEDTVDDMDDRIDLEDAESEPADDMDDRIDLEDAESEPADDMDDRIDLEDTEDEPVEDAESEPAEEIIFTPSYLSPYPLTEQDAGTYWGTPMDITDTEAIWTMLTAPLTVYDADIRLQKRVYAQPDANSRVVAVVTGNSQGVRVIETLDNGWSLIELYSSTFHDNSIQAWNMLVQGYVKTSDLKVKTVDKPYHIVVDKLTQRLYLFGEGELKATLLVSTGLANAKQPYNETRSGEFLYCSPTGGFKSDNMVCPMAMKFNDGDLLHEVPYVQRSGSSSRIYTSTEPMLGQRASHGCIRVQRKENPDGYNMEWIWDNRSKIGRIVVWEDWQGRQISYPAEDTVLYYNADGGSYYHSQDHCNSAKDHVVFSAFAYAELDTGDFAKLEYCPYCAPALRKAEIDAINAEHAAGGDHDPILTEARQKYLKNVIKKNGLEALTEGELKYYVPDAE